MNIAEAKEALRQGKRLTHLYFTDEEWVQGVVVNNEFEGYLFEDGISCSPSMFRKTRYDGDWDCGWSEVSA